LASKPAFLSASTMFCEELAREPRLIFFLEPLGEPEPSDTRDIFDWSVSSKSKSAGGLGKAPGALGGRPGGGGGGAELPGVEFPSLPVPSALGVSGLESAPRCCDAQRLLRE